MPLGSLHSETGLLLEQDGTLILQRDDGGRWRIDESRAVRRHLGRRVVIQGQRTGFDWLTVESIRDAPSPFG